MTFIAGTYTLAHLWPFMMRYHDPNHPYPPGSVAVIFCAQRAEGGEADYQKAAKAMEALAKMQDGFLDMHHARGADGFGITVSYWRDEAAAISWRDNVRHTSMRDEGRAKHYRYYTVTIADVTRGYSWKHNGP